MIGRTDVARLQILELPTEHHGDDMVTPFVLVIDQLDESLIDSIASASQSTAELIGARTILAFTETVDIPANETPVDPDGYPLKIRVEGDFDQFREQVQDEIRKAQAQMRNGAA
jgi:hypothetical protein